MSLTFCAVLAKRFLARNKFTRLTLPNKLTNKRLNGQRMNGQRMNGQRMNGQRMNGQRMNGQRMNGQRILLFYILYVNKLLRC